MAKIVVKPNVSKIVVRETRSVIKVYPDTKVIGIEPTYQEHRMAFNTDEDSGGVPPIFTILNESASNYLPIDWNQNFLSSINGQLETGLTNVKVYISLTNEELRSVTCSISDGGIDVLHNALAGMVGELWITADL